MKAITMDYLSVSANMDMVVEVLQKFGPTDSDKPLSKHRKTDGIQITVKTTERLWDGNQ